MTTFALELHASENLCSSELESDYESITQIYSKLGIQDYYHNDLYKNTDLKVLNSLIFKINKMGYENFVKNISQVLNRKMDRSARFNPLVLYRIMTYDYSEMHSRLEMVNLQKNFIKLIKEKKSLGLTIKEVSILAKLLHGYSGLDFKFVVNLYSEIKDYQLDHSTVFFDQRLVQKEKDELNEQITTFINKSSYSEFKKLLKLALKVRKNNNYYQKLHYASIISNVYKGRNSRTALNAFIASNFFKNYNFDSIISNHLTDLQKYLDTLDVSTVKQPDIIHLQSGLAENRMRTFFKNNLFFKVKKSLDVADYYTMQVVLSVMREIFLNNADPAINNTNSSISTLNTEIYSNIYENGKRVFSPKQVKKLVEVFNTFFLFSPTNKSVISLENTLNSSIKKELASKITVINNDNKLLLKKARKQGIESNIWQTSKRLVVDKTPVPQGPGKPKKPNRTVVNEETKRKSPKTPLYTEFELSRWIEKSKNKYVLGVGQLVAKQKYYVVNDKSVITITFSEEVINFAKSHKSSFTKLVKGLTKGKVAPNASTAGIKKTLYKYWNKPTESYLHLHEARPGSSRFRLVLVPIDNENNFIVHKMVTKNKFDHALKTARNLYTESL